MNPYMALRAEKIARNEARLKDLGLLNKPSSIPKKKKRQSSASSTAKNPKTVTPLRRSGRLSGKDAAEDKDHVDADNEGRKRRRKEPKEPVSSKPTPIAANSVRGLSLSASVLVEKFLGQYMEHTGKETVINRAFMEAAVNADEMKRMEGVKLSFNKYSGVQQWSNGAFLWVNMGNEAQSNTVVNEFLDDGKLVTWYGGSRMYEGSPVIQTLLKLGKQANTSTSDSWIILWCRAYDAKTKKFSPYCCMGRLAYHSHVKESYPVAFTWRLLDYSALMESPERREVFQRITSC